MTRRPPWSEARRLGQASNMNASRPRSPAIPSEAAAPRCPEVGCWDLRLLRR